LSIGLERERGRKEGRKEERGEREGGRKGGREEGAETRGKGRGEMNRAAGILAGQAGGFNHRPGRTKVGGSKMREGEGKGGKGRGSNDRLHTHSGDCVRKERRSEK
jgi:hypothetical protein